LNTQSISKQDYDDLRAFLETASGIVLGDNKHYLVSSRLNRVLTEFKLPHFHDLVQGLQNQRNMALRERVVDAMTTNETMWFRDIYPYEMLKTVLLPEFAKTKDRGLRIWSAACSSGQEPYSMSMIVQEFLAANAGAFSRGVQIVATDISPTMLSFAKAGLYDDAAIARGLSDDRRNKFFKRAATGWEIKPDLKTRVQFKPINLLQSYASMGKFDIIFCRNVLIYFSSEAKSDILNRLGESLNPDGYLMLGSSETPSRYSELFAMTRNQHGAIYKLVK